MRPIRDRDIGRLALSVDAHSHIPEVALGGEVELYNFSSPYGLASVTVTESGIRSLSLKTTVPLPASTTRLPQQNRALPGPVTHLLQSIEQRLLYGYELTDLPLDVPGTPFQHLVWRHLRQIPRGSTTTYAAVARGIGKPSAVRAVANACACNDVALAIPCHRVIRSNGSIGGYRWGTELKEIILTSEGTPAGDNHE